MKSKDIQKQQKILNPQQQKLFMGTLGYVDKEMSGFSDTFAYVKEDIALPHTYNYVGDNIQIFTPPPEKKNDKLNKREQNQKLAI